MPPAAQIERTDPPMMHFPRVCASCPAWMGQWGRERTAGGAAGRACAFGARHPRVFPWWRMQGRLPGLPYRAGHAPLGRREGPRGACRFVPISGGSSAYVTEPSESMPGSSKCGTLIVPSMRLRRVALALVLGCLMLSAAGGPAQSATSGSGEPCTGEQTDLLRLAREAGPQRPDGDEILEWASQIGDVVGSLSPQEMLGWAANPPFTDQPIIQVEDDEIVAHVGPVILSATERIVVEGGIFSAHGDVDNPMRSQIVLVAPIVEVHGELITSSGVSVDETRAEYDFTPAVGHRGQDGGDIVIIALEFKMGSEACMITGNGGAGQALFAQGPPTPAVPPGDQFCLIDGNGTIGDGQITGGDTIPPINMEWEGDPVCTPADNPIPDTPAATAKLTMRGPVLVGGDGGRGGDIRFAMPAEAMEIAGTISIGNGGPGGDVAMLGPGSAAVPAATGIGGAGGRSGLIYASGTIPFTSMPSQLTLLGGIGGDGGDANLDFLTDEDDWFGVDLDGVEGVDDEDYGTGCRAAPGGRDGSDGTYGGYYTHTHWPDADPFIPEYHQHGVQGTPGFEGEPGGDTNTPGTSAFAHGGPGGLGLRDGGNGGSGTAVGACGGDGGDGGNGGPGGWWEASCGFDGGQENYGRGGDGSYGTKGLYGGDAEATGGKGGDGLLRYGGDGGRADATGGNGGDGGDSGDGGDGFPGGYYGPVVGAFGAGGTASNAPGAPGSGPLGNGAVGGGDAMAGADGATGEFGEMGATIVPEDQVEGQMYTCV